MGNDNSVLCIWSTLAGFFAAALPPFSIFLEMFLSSCMVQTIRSSFFFVVVMGGGIYVFFSFSLASYSSFQFDLNWYFSSQLFTFFFFFSSSFTRQSSSCCLSFGLTTTWLTLFLLISTSSASRMVSILVAHDLSSLSNSAIVSFLLPNYLSNFEFSSSNLSKCGFHCFSSCFLCSTLSCISLSSLAISSGEAIFFGVLVLPFLTIKWYFLISLSTSVILAACSLLWCTTSISPLRKFYQQCWQGRLFCSLLFLSSLRRARTSFSSISWVHNFLAILRSSSSWMMYSTLSLARSRRKASILALSCLMSRSWMAISWRMGWWELSATPSSGCMFSAMIATCASI